MMLVLTQNLLFIQLSRKLPGSLLRLIENQLFEEVRLKVGRFFIEK